MSVFSKRFIMTNFKHTEFSTVNPVPITPFNSFQLTASPFQLGLHPRLRPPKPLKEQLAGIIYCRTLQYISLKEFKNNPHSVIIKPKINSPIISLNVQSAFRSSQFSSLLVVWILK